jgi:beta-lactamase class A
VSVEEALVAMMSYSDNVAANLLLDRVGVTNTNSAVRLLGLDRSGFVGTDVPTSAADMERLLEAIALGAALGEDTDAEMVEALELEQIDNRLPALLPKDTRIAHKTGSWDTATNDAGIVFSPEATYVIVVLTDFGFTEDGAGVIARLSRAVYDYYRCRAAEQAKGGTRCTRTCASSRGMPIGSWRSRSAITWRRR